MKTLLLILALALAPACLSAAPPSVREQHEELERELEAARLTPSPLDDEAVIERLSDLEAKMAAEQVGPFAALLPAGLGALVTGLVPLLGKRGRKHYWNAVRKIPKGQVLAAAGDVMKAIGAQHSTPESEAAANPQPPSQS